jgi:hypothetical protein
MKRVFTLLILFCSCMNLYALTAIPAVHLSTFKHIPDEMIGCCNCYYLSEKDKKQGILIGIDDLAVIMVSLNGKLVKFKPGKDIKSKQHNDFYYQNYQLTIDTFDQKQKDDEYYVFKAVITIKTGGKTVYQQKVIGDGGC